MIRRPSCVQSFGPALILAAATGISGCHALSHRDSAACETVVVPAPVPVGAPVLRVLTDCTEANASASRLLATEIRAALADLGGLRLSEQAVDADCCESSSCGPARVTESLAEEMVIPLPGSESMSGPLGPVASGTGATDAEQFRVLVRIDELRAYHPMRLSASVAVIDVVSGQELSLIQKTWNAPDSTAVRRTRWPKLLTLHHPLKPEEQQSRAMMALSPALLLKTAAREVAPAIHATCMCSAPPDVMFTESSVVTESIPLVPLESPMPP